MTRILSIVAFVLGAIIVLWMASAFVGSNLLALAVTLLIAGAYTVGFAELLRYQQSSLSLSAALDEVNEPLAELGPWLAKVPTVLRNAVRQRIQGEYVGLPAPVLAPYLIGLLVMLGLLGTFIGMVDTLKGAVMALEGTTELEAIRTGLAAPIKGLGMAFATSVAGVTASAMLGFISTLSRRERLQVSRQLDSSMATVFKNFSLAYQRQQSYAAMQTQAQALPQVVESLGVLAERISHMGENLGATLVAAQSHFHSEAQSHYKELAQSVDASLSQSLAASGRVVGESVGPVVQSFMQEISEELRQSQQQLAETAQSHLLDLNTRVADSAVEFSQGWRTGIAEQQRGSESLLQSMTQQFFQLSEGFAASGGDLLSRFDGLTENWQQSLQATEEKRQQSWSAVFNQSAELLQSSAEGMATKSKELLTRFDGLTENWQQNLLSTEAKRQASWSAVFEQSTELLRSNSAGIAAGNDELLKRFDGLTENWQQQQQAGEQQRLQNWSSVFDQSAELLRSSAEQLAVNARTGSQELMAEFSGLLGSSEQLLDARQASESQWLAEYQQRMTELGVTLKTELAGLHELEEQRGIAAVERLGELQSAVAVHLSTLANALEEPMGRLIESASETPRIAAELMGQLRAEMSENLERDNSLLDDRRELMVQLKGLSESLQESAAGQRTAVENILNNSAGILADVSNRFNEKLVDETGKLDEILTHFEASSGDLASLGEAFASAVSQFGDSNRELIATLSKVEASLQHSGERSDEQMAYYVAQAREIIDHNMMTQQDIIKHLQELSQGEVMSEDAPA
jgi:hypothetical protein